ncbi:MAG: Unknown protein [uncultured Sulfurovum sp.]|uniref:DUF1302 domain-containing protein n=1 Tax=uncultured Sulfurovum sp. TaxID=269237 RepID=A0A6S6SK03_9BACT|nr:MAG: Unknown protein [uncultured Sulfurovum sp.]
MFCSCRVLSLTTPSRPKLAFLAMFLMSSLNAENLDALMDGFDEEPKVKTEIKKDAVDDIMEGFDDEPISSSKKTNFQKPKVKEAQGALTGRITEQIAYAYSSETPHDNFSLLKSSLLLDYEYKFENGFKFKTNAKAYYDAIYSLRGREKYAKDELDELESEVELFDAYLEGSLSDNFDMKLGRQVVVWGRSDTIRITDVLNPLDNRHPGIVDIEDLRLPVAMAKFDYFVGDWRITPMAILEQRFSKNPPAGSVFNASSISLPSNENYADVLPALSIGAEFSGWDANFYVAQMRDDTGYFANGKMQHDKVNMLGAAFNVLNGSWLLKSEFAHFEGLKYTTTGNKEFKRSDALLGLEYNGIADTLISYDASIRKLHDYDNRLINERFSVDEARYQHAFRMSSDFMNATLKANYLVSLFGKSLDEGGFQRAWVKYDIADGVYTNLGLIDYIAGSQQFDTMADNDMIFWDVSYSF